MIGNTKDTFGYAGCREVRIEDSSVDLTFPMTVMYPAGSPEQVERLGPYLLELARDAEPMGGRFPLIIISHGTGGSPLVYRTLARHLARNGFIVGMPEHPYNNRNDNSLEGTVQNLAYRPRHLSMAIDWFFENKIFTDKLRLNAVSVIGHSLGGYTALAAAGGMPISFPHESSDGKPQHIEVTPDNRIKTLVLLAPASVWFRAEGALRAVNLPILMLDAEKDPYTPPFHAQIILGGVADLKKIQYRTVENAGHFSFLSPFPESMKTPAFLPSQDPPGFDREHFHETLHADILAFLNTHSDGGEPYPN
ncbi:alpha/beta hydrolase family protein [Paenibacillus sedimenti]|uniref:Alpha/beta fold hydrolase n=1 Tax=Paenibacillus sedimenti TaxID=2770274 RepID=A0A926KLY3_9BACL|nr:alpha/beta fold hydrolase [Paenibacillus sedimenti]MBD0380085.1 alpha/beta fold hydrolase [Paenibacillus sedimenti]